MKGRGDAALFLSQQGFVRDAEDRVREPRFHCYPIYMARTIEAEYLAEQNVLKLTAPLTDVRDHTKLAVEIKEVSATPQAQPWMSLAGSLDGHSGREVTRLVNEAFGRDLDV